MEKPNLSNPLVPKGSLNEYSKGKSSVRMAFFTIAGIHVLFITVFLIAGCRRDAKVPDVAQNDTNAAPPFPALTNDTLGIAQSNPPPDPIPTNPGNVAITPDTNQPIIADPVLPTAAIVEAPAPTGPAYTVGSGETLAGIAKKNGVSLQGLLEANPGVSPRKLKAGQKINLPAGASNPGKPSTSTTTAVSNNGGSTRSQNTYVVKAGDTLTKIARTHGMPIKDLRTINKLKTDALRPGQKLKVTGSGAPTEQSSLTLPRTPGATNPTP